MDVRFFHTFIEVASTRHFGKAAENLYLTQSAVSARIRQLEEYFNAPLFVRERHSIRLTSVGEKILPYAHSMVNTLQDARKSVDLLDVKHLSVGASNNVWHCLFDSTIESSLQQFPDLSLRCDTYNTDQLSRKLHERRIDIALSFEHLKSDDFATHKVGFIALKLYQTPQSSAQEAMHNFIQIDWANKFQSQQSADLVKTLHTQFRSNCVQLAISILKRQSTASVLLPPHIAGPLIAQEVLVEAPMDNTPALCLHVSYLNTASQTSLADYIAFFTELTSYQSVLIK